MIPTYAEGCTADPFGYGEIIVVDMWGSYETLPADSGYIVYWGWKIQFKDVESDDPYSLEGTYPTQGIIIDYDLDGPYGYDTGASWMYTDDDSKIDTSLYTANPGTYTFSVVDFDNFGAYCGDGDIITINVGGNNDSSSTSSDSTSINEDDIEITSSEDVELKLSVDKDEVTPREDFDYKVEVINNGEKYVYDVGIEIGLPDGVTLIFYSCMDDTFYETDDGGRDVTCTIDSIAPKASQTIEIAVTVNDDVEYATVLGFGARVEPFRAEDTKQWNNDEFLESPIVLKNTEDVGLVLSVDKAEVAPGEDFVYEVQVTNKDEKYVNDVGIIISLPDGVTLISYSCMGQFFYEIESGGSDITCNIGTMQPKEIQIIKVEVYVNNDVDPLDTTVLGFGAWIEPFRADDRQQWDNDRFLESPTVVQYSEDVGLVLSVDKAEVAPGEDFVYKVQVTNKDEKYVHDVGIIIGLPDGVTFVSYSCMGQVFEIENVGLDITCNIGTMQPKEIQIIEILATANDDIEHATVLGFGAWIEPFRADDRQQWDNDRFLESPTVKKPNSADIEIRVRTLYDTVLTGSPVYYSIHVYNHGSDVANNIVAQVTLPDQVLHAMTDYECVSNYDVESNTITCDVGTLQPGESIYRSIARVMIANDIQDGTVLVATGNIPRDDDPNMSNNQHTLEAPKIQRRTIDLEIEISASTYFGNNIHYSVKIKNHGPDWAHGVIAELTLPDPTLSRIPYWSFICYGLEDPRTSLYYDSESNTVECDIGSLPPDGHVFRSMAQVYPYNEIPQGTVFVTSAKVSGIGDDTNLSNNQITHEYYDVTINDTTNDLEIPSCTDETEEEPSSGDKSIFIECVRSSADQISDSNAQLIEDDIQSLLRVKEQLESESDISQLAINRLQSEIVNLQSEIQKLQAEIAQLQYQNASPAQIQMSQSQLSSLLNQLSHVNSQLDSEQFNFNSIQLQLQQIESILDQLNDSLDVENVPENHSHVKGESSYDSILDELLFGLPSNCSIELTQECLEAIPNCTDEDVLQLNPMYYAFTIGEDRQPIIIVGDVLQYKTSDIDIYAYSEDKAFLGGWFGDISETIEILTPSVSHYSLIQCAFESPEPDLFLPSGMIPDPLVEFEYEISRITKGDSGICIIGQNEDCQIGVEEVPENHISTTDYGSMIINDRKFNPIDITQREVNLDGEINDYTFGTVVMLIIEKPDGTIIEKGFAARHDGTFNEQIALDDTWEPGRYVVKTTYQGEEIGSFSFYIDMERVPEWVKNNAKWWSEGQIGDSDFINGLQFLIKEGIMVVPQTEAGTQPTTEIPSWIKSNAGWWADGLITEGDFLSGIQFLVENGILVV